MCPVDGDNPYVAPESISASAEDVEARQPEPFSVRARSIFLAWERLRLIYNGVLVFVVLLLAIQSSASVLLDPRFWGTALAGAVMANVCFFAGPVVETYVSWLGFRSTALRTILFVLGTALACILAVTVMAVELFVGLVVTEQVQVHGP